MPRLPSSSDNAPSHSPLFFRMPSPPRPPSAPFPYAPLFRSWSPPFALPYGPSGHLAPIASYTRSSAPYVPQPAADRKHLGALLLIPDALRVRRLSSGMRVVSLS